MLVALGLGSNLGDRIENLRRATALLSRLLQLTGVSSVYETEPRDVLDQPPFLNAALTALTDLDPQALLHACHDVEVAIGRIPGRPKGPRSIDVDVLLHGDSIVSETGLVVPHPALARRRFVLVPLAEIAPDLREPLGRATISELLARCEDPGWVRSAAALR
ncbi:MAG: 2-amino-4-hydroxy-6-hydroxymethyldihydropteridine diphosphokinase [Acidobacteriota bacterium]